MEKACHEVIFDEKSINAAAHMSMIYLIKFYIDMSCEIKLKKIQHYKVRVTFGQCWIPRK